MTTPEDGPAATAAYPAPNPMPNTWMNVVAFVTALVGMAIVPIVFGHMGVSAANKGKADLKWMGIVGLVIGYVEVAVIVILILVLIVLAIVSASTS